MIYEKKKLPLMKYRREHEVFLLEKKQHSFYGNSKVEMKPFSNHCFFTAIRGGGGDHV